MPSVGPNFPTSATGNTNALGLGTQAWTNPANIEAADGVFTTTTLVDPQTSDDLIGTGFGFNIPAGSTINGILLEINYKSSAGTIDEDFVQLVKAGSAVGNNKGSITVTLPTTAVTRSYGSASDLWGTTWTPADINNSGFGAVFVCVSSAGTSTASVDFFRITVTYTTAAANFFLFFD